MSRIISSVHSAGWGAEIIPEETGLSCISYLGAANNSKKNLSSTLLMRQVKVAFFCVVEPPLARVLPDTDVVPDP